jgi:hypothetical protein
MSDDRPPARQIWAALHLLDRQLRARDGSLCGKVDDLELTIDDRTGAFYVSAILSGPGRLLGRVGRHRLGDWLVRFARHNTPDDRDATRIPMQLVNDRGPVLDLAVDVDDLASNMGERWARDHIISHIPGNRHEAE